MKTIRFILMVLGLLFHQSGIAQEEGQMDYYPIGTKWEEVQYEIDRPLSFSWTSEVVGDTIINEKTYRWVEVNAHFPDKSSNTYFFAFPHREYGIRQQGDSVFYYGPIDITYTRPSEIISERLVYNFNWAIGSSHDEIFHDYVIGENDVQMVSMSDGKPYEVIQYFDYSGGIYHIHDTYDFSSCTNQFIRTVGKTKKGFMEKITGSNSFSCCLVSFTRNGQLIYYNPSMDLTVGISETVDECPRVTSRYDVGGRAIGSSARGLQIERLFDGTVRKIFRR